MGGALVEKPADGGVDPRRQIVVEPDDLVDPGEVGGLVLGDVVGDVAVESTDDLTGRAVDDLDVVGGRVAELALGELGAAEVGGGVADPADPHATSSIGARSSKRDQTSSSAGRMYSARTCSMS